MQSPYTIMASLPPDIFESHLNILMDPNAATPLLWRRNLEMQREYFEIDVFNDPKEGIDVPFNKDIDAILNLNKYTCHICNIEVPKGYMKEHNATDKHKSCNEIAILALERTRLQVQLEVDTSCRIEVSDTYFCNTCSVVVLNSEKEKHQKDYTHKISSKHDEMLSDMVKIYSNRENVEVKSEIDEFDILTDGIKYETFLKDIEWCEKMNRLKMLETEERLTKQLKERVYNILVDQFHSLISQEREELKVEAIRFGIKTKIQHHIMAKECDALRRELLDINRDPASLSKVKPTIGLRNSKNKAWKMNQIPKKNEPFPTAFVNKDTQVSGKNNISMSFELSPSVVQRPSQCIETDDWYSDNFTPELKKKEPLIFENNNNIVVLENEPSNTPQLTVDVQESDGDNVVNDINSKNNSEEIQIDIIAQNHKKLSDDFKTRCDLVINKTNTTANKAIRNKINEVLANFFNENHTVDALNDCTEREHKKKVMNKKERKIKTNKKQNNKLPEQIAGTEGQNTVNVEQKADDAQNKDKQEQNKNKNKTIQNDNKGNIVQKIKKKKNNKQAIVNKKQDKCNIEQNNNKKTVQNKNNDSTTKTNNQSKNIHTKQKKNLNSSKATKLEESLPPSISDYLKNITWRCQTKPIHTVDAITDTVLQITAINGAKIRVLVYSFHSFHNKSQDHYCKICERPNVKRPAWHIMENEHMAKVMIPIEDHHGIRQLDDIWSHCILCNEMTKTLNDHLKSLPHKNKLKHSLIALGKNDNDSNDSCHSNKPSVCQSEKTECQTEKQIPEEQKTAIAGHMLLNNLVMTNKDYLSCAICNVIVTYDLTSVKRHIMSRDHLENFEREQDSNKLIDVGERYYCIPCDVNIANEEIAAHCNGRRHKKMLKEMLARDQGSVVNTVAEDKLPSISHNMEKSFNDNYTLICFVCNSPILGPEDHMNSNEHAENYNKYLECHNIKEPKTDNYFCTPCNTGFTIDYLMGHCKSAKHCTALKNLTGATVDGIDSDKTSQIESSEGTSVVTPAINEADRSLPRRILYQFRYLDDPDSLLCVVCFEEVSYTRKDAEHHIFTLNHVTAFNLMMLWNKIKKRDDEYFCDVCRSQIEYFNEIIHVLGKHHMDNIAKEPKGTVYEYNRTFLTHGYAISHKIGDRMHPSSVSDKN